MNEAPFARADLDVGAANQAFSHFSRMHTSSAAAFFASLFAYLTYVGFYVRNFGRDVTGLSHHLVLTGVPALAPMFLGARYWSVNTALKNAAEDVRACRHPWGDKVTAGCSHPTLHEYVSGRYSAPWLAVTQRNSVPHWVLLGVAALLLIWFAWEVWQAAAGARPNANPLHGMSTGPVIPEPWWQSSKLWAGLLGVVVGFILAEAKDWLVRRRRRKAHWAALRAEIEFCRRMAETYSRDRVMAPLYRLPTAAYAQSLPALLADGLLTESDTYSMIQFFTEVETLNRGLDLAQAAREHNDNHALQEEFDRNLLKAQRLVPHEGHAQNYYQPARAVVDAHL